MYAESGFCVHRRLIRGLRVSLSAALVVLLELGGRGPVATRLRTLSALSSSSSSEDSAASWQAHKVSGTGSREWSRHTYQGGGGSGMG